MGDTHSTADELSLLDQKWEQITDTPATPRSVMDVIEYSLGSQRKAEVYTNRLLAYFLDPDQPHGMGSDFLRYFLEGLPATCDFREDIHDLSDVVVEDQVQVSEMEEGEDISSGIADLVVEAGNEWFLLIELKYSAKDHQTRFYYREATHVGGEPKDDYESGTYYVYLHQDDRPQATEPQFANWTWVQFCDDVLEPFLIENSDRYPHRTIVQLREFRDDIQSIAGMTEPEQDIQEKVALYLEHYDVIEDVSGTFDSEWSAFTDTWGSQLGETLQREGHGTYSDFDEDVTAVELEDGTNWRFRTSSSDWGMVFKDGWWRRTDELDKVIHGRPDDRNDVRIGFHHRLERHRDLAVGDRTLKFYFRNMGANDQAFIDTFAESFSERRSEISERLPPNVEVTGNKRNLFAATHDITPESPEAFFDAYVASLEAAFVDLVVDDEGLIALIDDLYEDAIENVYGKAVSLT
jgi:hypothetical protein